MAEDKQKLMINENNLREINEFILNDDNPLLNQLLEVVEKYGGVNEINTKAREASKYENLIERLRKKNSSYAKKLDWLIDQRDKDLFISVQEYREKLLGHKASSMKFDETFAVTLEISGCNFFLWLIEECKKAIHQQDLMPARYIRVRSMKEQLEDGDILAFSAAMRVLGASFVQTLDTKGNMLGADGKPINIHLGGPETITGYFGGLGVPNEYSLKWVEELLYYYTEYGIPQVLNVNTGTVILACWLYKLGINIESKISVYLGNDNPYAGLWSLMIAKLFSRDDGTTPLIGLNVSNSVNNKTIELLAYIRKAFGFEDIIRIEHHIVETWKGIVIQPYNRLNELLDIADHVKNISAKHEGAFPDVDMTREHPSDVLDYFLSKKEIMEKGLMSKLLNNYTDKHDAVNKTAQALTKQGLSVIAAQNLHKKL